MAKHPAAQFIKYQLIKNQDVTDAEVLKTLEDWGFLHPMESSYLGFLRQGLPERPKGFDPADKLHRPSMKYLRDQGVYELFHPNDASQQAWDILSNPHQRLAVEQVLLARLPLKESCKRLNQVRDWTLTAEGCQAFQHFFWNVPSMTFDEWGRFLYGRSAMYERQMALLTAPQELAFFHLRLEQQVDSMNMLKRAQEIAYFTLEEVNEKPGTGVDKVKAIGVLSKVIKECHEARTTSDMALKDVLKQFEKWRMEHPQLPSPDIKQLAPHGNFSGSGADDKAAVNAKKEG